MENRVGTAGGTVEFEYKVESNEAGKWYQGKTVFFNFRADLFCFRIFITPLESERQGYNR